MADPSKAEEQGNVGPSMNDEEKMAVMLEVFLRANPHTKGRISDAASGLADLSKQELEYLESLLISSNLFIIFKKNGANLFMLKDSVREGLIEAGSYSKFLADNKSLGEMSHEEADLARRSDQEDEIRRKDEEKRRNKAKQNRIIMVVGVLAIVLLLVLAKFLMTKMKNG
jgi:hypothetical protein